jgi:hypothetical protein
MGKARVYRYGRDEKSIIIDLYDEIKEMNEILVEKAIQLSSFGDIILSDENFIEKGKTMETRYSRDENNWVYDSMEFYGSLRKRKWDAVMRFLEKVIKIFFFIWDYC